MAIKNTFFTILMAAVLMLVPAFFLLSLELGTRSEPLTPEQPEAFRSFDRMQSAKIQARRNLDESLSSVGDWTLLIVAQAALVSLALLIGRASLFGKTQKHPQVYLNKPLLVLGVAGLLLGPLAEIVKPDDSWFAGSGWPFFFLLVFFAGWIIAAAALRPFRSYFRGALLGFFAYMLVGFSWAATYYIEIGETCCTEFAGEIYDSLNIFVMVSFLWPVFLVQWLELFGFGSFLAALLLRLVI